MATRHSYPFSSSCGADASLERWQLTPHVGHARAVPLVVQGELRGAQGASHEAGHALRGLLQAQRGQLLLQPAQALLPRHLQQQVRSASPGAPLMQSAVTGASSQPRRSPHAICSNRRI